MHIFSSALMLAGACLCFVAVVSQDVALSAYEIGCCLSIEVSRDGFVPFATIYRNAGEDEKMRKMG